MTMIGPNDLSGRLTDEIDGLGAIDQNRAAILMLGEGRHSKAAAVFVAISAMRPSTSLRTSPGEAGRLDNRQRIHFGPQPDDLLAAAIAQGSDQTRAAKSALDGIALFFQF
ncbi:hypothetical protein ABHV46_07515 [Asaia sp. BMEF1]|uniref:hypothetical protein n=1 Tax=Asaia sp. BMEF1 TaxID=3155932 RepID=UPI003F67026D